jgi:hypothetical protein
VTLRLEKVDRYDRELLDKQTQRLGSSRNDGVIMSTVVAMFFVGIALGALFAHQSVPTRTASNDMPATVSLPNGSPVGSATHYYR